jgi:hypothetical protein
MIPPEANEKREEERKRDAVLNRDPAQRWRMQQEELGRLEASLPLEKRRNRPRRPHQR